MEGLPWVDSHFHIWELERFKYRWPTAQEGPLFRNITAAEAEREMKTTPVRHAVFVQCMNHCPEEAEWVMGLAETHPFIKGVVAGVDLSSPQLEATLDRLQKFPLFKGVRHILDFENEAWLTRKEVHRGLEILQERDLTFDLLLRPHLLKYVPELGEKFPRLRMVVDHIAKPFIKDGKVEGWQEDIAALAKFPNIYCKLSGLVVEADWNNWKKEDFVPYISHVLSVFGVERCMFGSDWPVCFLAHASYKDVLDLLRGLVESWSDQDKVKVFRDNAAKFYRLNV